MAELNRRDFLAASGAVAAAGAAAPAFAAATDRPRPLPPIGSGGAPMGLPELAELAKAEGGGYPILFCDLAALDRNIAEVAGFARRQGWRVRPALKSFRSPKLIGYVLRRLPRPLGLVFNLDEIEPILEQAPPGTDLLGGYAPTFGELEQFLAAQPAKASAKPHRVRILIDSVPLMEELARLARSSRRRLPIHIAIELDVGMGKGGISDRSELERCLAILRANRDRLRLGGVLGYDGHATLDGASGYRQAVAAQAQSAYREHLRNLEQLGADLFEPARLIRNGPGSSNYRNWPGGPINEISPGSAFLLAGYLESGFETEGLSHALTMAGAIRRITSGHPSVPAFDVPIPGTTQEEVVVQAVGEPSELRWPGGGREDDLSGGGDAFVFPKGAAKLGEYVLYRPEQTEVGIRKFATLTAVREGRVRRLWPVQRRPG